MSTPFEDLERLFHAAATLTPAEQREFLDRLPEEETTLRSELEELLEISSAAGEYFDAEPQLDATKIGAVGPGDRVGEFRITGLIASGGMGHVFTAEQQNPRRSVALKVIRSGLSSESELRRFELEAQILGALRHPGVAHVYGAGLHQSETGEVPWFAMELIDGDTLTDYAIKRDINQRSRLELFLQICDAAEHAHRRGIIHRDLKPANIMVTNDGVPKILDFGIARATHPDSQIKTIESDFGRLVGTLAYMSPEQTLADPYSIDTRSDVYALGAILFELLTGELVFDLRDCPLVEALRIIREVDAPSLSTMDSKLRGDLEVIVSRALEKDRERRYGGAAELAGDLRRHLAHQPILARPAGLTYRFAKLVRRNPALTFAVTGALLALFIGIAGTLLGFLDAREQSKKKDAAIADFERMSDVKRLELALAAADVLWPEHPDLIPDLERWQEDYGELFQHLVEHHATLERLRASAQPYGESERRRDRPDDYAAVDELKNRRERIESLLDDPADEKEEASLERELDAAEERLEKLRQELKARHRWYFGEDIDKQFLHDTLTTLVAELEKELVSGSNRGVVASIARRLSRSRRIEQETVAAQARAWTEARRRLFEDERFSEAALEPIVGLIPLGADPASGLEEFLHWPSHEGPTPSRSDGKLVLSEDTGILLVLLPGGRFTMGSQAIDPDGPFYDPMRGTSEGPLHAMNLSPFFLSKYEVTQGQWERVMDGARPSAYAAGGIWVGVQVSPLHPVEGVSWGDCTEMCRRTGFALPTEAQWEYAARAGTTSVWHTGSDASSLDGYANISYDDRTRVRGADRYPFHSPVGSLAPNDFGFHDMHGNLWEWCRDIHTTNYNAGTFPPRSGDGLRTWPSSPSPARAIRGGSFMHTPIHCRSARRFPSTPSVRDNTLGFRPSMRAPF